MRKAEVDATKSRSVFSSTRILPGGEADSFPLLKDNLLPHSNPRYQNPWLHPTWQSHRLQPSRIAHLLIPLFYQIKSQTKCQLRPPHYQFSFSTSWQSISCLRFAKSFSLLHSSNCLRIRCVFLITTFRAMEYRRSCARFLIFRVHSQPSGVGNQALILFQVLYYQCD